MLVFITLFYLGKYFYEHQASHLYVQYIFKQQTQIFKPVNGSKLTLVLDYDFGS